MELTSNGSSADKRLLRACDSCYKRKIKCDGVRPRCEWCSSHNIDCTFFRQPRVRKRRDHAPSEKSRIARLEGRLRALEAAVVSTNEPNSNASERLVGASTTTTANTISPTTIADEDQSPMSMDASPSLAPHAASDPALLSHDQPLRNYSPALEALAGSYGTPEHNSPLPPPPQGTDIHGLHFAGQHLGSLSSFYGIPIFDGDWVRRRTGDDFAFVPDHLHTLIFQDPQLSNKMPTPVLAKDELPDRQKVTNYIVAYQSSPLVDVFPMIDPDDFRNTITIAYGETQEPPWRVVVARFDVCAVTTFLAAIIGHVLKLEDCLTDLDGLARVAWSYGTTSSTYPATIEALQGTFALYFFELARGDMQKVDYLISTCVRLVYNMGLHKTPQTRESQSKIDVHKRDLFWLCYIIDKEHTLRTGRPPMMIDDHCDLTFPPRYLAQLADPDSSRQQFPTDPKLSVIKAKAFHDLYSVAALRKSDIEIIMTIRQLDEQLEDWRQSMPPSIRPSLAHQVLQGREVWTILNLSKLMIRLEYHHVTAIIHQASSRCVSWSSNRDAVAEGINSSLAVSVAASRSTLLSLLSTTETFPRPFLWVLLFYPMSAILTIFCSILDEPLAATSKTDLHLLEQVARILTPDAADPTVADINIHAHIQVGFAREVARLARLAICKAQQESA